MSDAYSDAYREVVARTQESRQARPEHFLEQLQAALARHDEVGGNWATLGAVITACGAVWGDPYCRRELAERDAWKLTSDGLLPSGPVAEHVKGCQDP